MKAFYIETYGCQMNIYDSQLVSGILMQQGYQQAESLEAADIILLNTCSVREKAESRIRGRASQISNLKASNPHLILGIMGCMAQRLGEKLLKDLPFLDIVIGTDSYYSLPENLEKVGKTHKPIAITNTDNNLTYENISPYHQNEISTFVTIMRGCNNFCSYCIVPYVRGRERSRNMEDIVDYVRRLAQSGVREVTLLGQNVNSYKSGDNDFPDLLKEINKIDDIYRIRFTSSHPKDLSDKLIETMAQCDSVCDHLHLAMQSGSNAVLDKMNRKYTREHYLNLIKKLRKAMPNMAISTDVIAGFPGETEDDFQQTLELMQQIQFDFAFMFRYSVRSGTAAEKFSDDVPEQIKLRRLAEIIELQHKITMDKIQQHVGRTVEVLVETQSPKYENQVKGKTTTFKTVVFQGDKNLIGKRVNVEILEAKGLTLIGKML